MRGRFSKISLILVFVIFVGCAKQVSLPARKGFLQPLPAKLSEKLNSFEKIKTLKAYANVSLIQKGKKRAFDLVVVISSPDKMRLEFVDQLAGPLAVLIIDGDRFVYTDGERVYDKKDQAESAFKRVTKLPWGGKDIIKILRGSLPGLVSPVWEKLESENSEDCFRDGDKLLVLSSDEQNVKYLVSNKNKPYAEIKFSDYGVQNKIYMPRKIDLKAFKAKTELKLFYQSVDINKPVDDHVFSFVN